MECIILLKHNAWANRMVLQACRPLANEQFGRRFDIGPGSLHDTTRHIVGAMRRWADRIAPRDVRPTIETPENVLTAAELLDLHESAAADLAAVVENVIVTGRVAEIMEFTPPGCPTARFSRSAAIAHVLTHGVHHRAQCLHMLRRLGIGPLPEIAVIDWEMAEGLPV